MAQPLASLLSLILSPYAQAPVVAPYSLTQEDTRTLARLEWRAEAPGMSAGSGDEAPASGTDVWPVMGLGFEFFRGSYAPHVRASVGLQIAHEDFRLKILPQVVFSTGSKWDSSVMGGLWYGASAELAARFGSLWLEPSFKMQAYQQRSLGDPEGETRYAQDESFRVALGASYRPEEGLYLGVAQKAWFLGASAIHSPGLKIEMSKDSVWVSEIAAGWSWSGRRLSGKWTRVAGVNNTEEHSFRGRGAFDDQLLSPQRAEVEMAWLF